MSDTIKHECGLAFIRLLKPLQYYYDKYGTALYGIKKLQLLLQKQRNRGQDGAGMATIKTHMPPGSRYISRKRSNSATYLEDVFSDIYAHYNKLTPEQLADGEWIKANMPYSGEVILGHLRYGTHGINTIESVHPFLRLNNWITRNLVMAGNFNLTNVSELFDELISFGQHPKEDSDTVTIMEKIGHFLDDEVQKLFSWFKTEGHTNFEITDLICDRLDVKRLLQRATRKFDGGYVMAGILGHGDSFILRDPNGIRPAFYYQNDEVVVMASERPAIQTSFNVNFEDIKELKRGHALIVKRDGSVSEDMVLQPQERKACSFERIYFSRGNDRDIYLERKKLGELLAIDILKEIDYDVENAIFSFIPNTAEVAFYGLVEGLHKELDKVKKQRILDLGENVTKEEVESIFRMTPRVEKLAVKDAKMRTFIADDKHRGGLVSHVYDVTYGLVNNKKDTLILMDDSIVRGTTLKDSIIQILSTLLPKKLIIVSSAPQIRYPDCYGIDMSKMKNFVAFKALVKLLEETGKENLLEETYHKCKAELEKPDHEIGNPVKELYALFSYQQISDKIAEIVTPKGFTPEIKVIYQTIENLHGACPNNNGDWYFSGDYPTPGGMKVVNRAFINFIEKIDARAYN
ncbi:MAG: amidophosphoribosyltransferase [Saprospiraceae bacterium]|nr:amidophosphoribosyltransferase [Bacteroidia bacterium]NNE16027.1 amidophosphoribosyltransferase [Saprospiraceae bacterium]NNL93423.1 amidophosphoribosyltransferase [Saprospiraceae bacterium]